MDYQVYIIQSDNGKRYIGFSEDPCHRLDQHNGGVCKHTAKYQNWQIHWTSIPMDRKAAFNLEKKMKRQKGGAGLEVLMRTYGKSAGS